MWELQTVFERQNETPFGILWLGKQLGFILDVSVCVYLCLDERRCWVGTHPSLVWAEGREHFQRQCGFQYESNLKPTNSEMCTSVITVSSCLI